LEGRWTTGKGTGSPNKERIKTIICALSILIPVSPLLSGEAIIGFSCFEIRASIYSVYPANTIIIPIAKLMLPHFRMTSSDNLTCNSLLSVDNVAALDAQKRMGVVTMHYGNFGSS
jgi:hypothetical protein